MSGNTLAGQAKPHHCFHFTGWKCAAGNARPQTSSLFLPRRHGPGRPCRGAPGAAHGASPEHSQSRCRFSSSCTLYPVPAWPLLSTWVSSKRQKVVGCSFVLLCLVGYPKNTTTAASESNFLLLKGFYYLCLIR